MPLLKWMYCALILLSAAPIAHAQTWGLRNLYIFQGGVSGPDAATPYGGVILGTDGNYYGTTWYGGSGSGAVFKVTPDGTESVVYAFGGTQDGQLPFALVQGPNGNFYGTTFHGGGGDEEAGIIYEVTPSGVETILQSLSDNGGGPSAPNGGLTLGHDGNFYGTSAGGGTNGGGTFFRMTPEGALTVIYSFSGSSGTNPHGELIQLRNRDFVGATAFGGDGGYGTVFKISSAGKLTVLHAFTGGSDGAQPFAPLVQGQDGNYYGTTQAGGTGNCSFPGLPSGCGTVFRITPDGAESVIYTFAGYPTDGSAPVGGLTQAKDGTLYGTTTAGGFTDPGNCSSGCGTIFSLTPSGSEQILYACGAPPDPWYYDCWGPSGTLLLSGSDTLTGTSGNGGGGWGNVFQIAPLPTVTLAAAPTSILLHQATELTWTSSHAKSCEAGGAWNGVRAHNGSSSKDPVATGSFTYTLTCTGVGGTASASATVTVTE